MSVSVKSAAIGPSIVTDGLVLYLDAANPLSYPGSGTVWYDLSNNDINGTMSNSTMGTFEDGNMRLNNTTDSLSFGHNILLEPANLTVSAWINLLDRGDRHILLTKWLGFSFEISSSGYPYFRLNGVSPGDLTSSEALTWGSWYHITGVFDDVANHGDIYINGINRGSATRTGSISYNQGSFNIPYVNNPVYGYGKIAVVQIYNKAITESENLQNYNALKNRFGL